MINVLNVIYMSATMIAVHGQTGTCCYNAECALPNFEPWTPFNLTRGTGITDYTTSINAVSCCPSGGNVLSKFNGGSSADTLCRCYNNGFIEQTCPYIQSDTLQCNNVEFDDGCPDLRSLGNTQTNNGDVSCIIVSSNGIHYVPQRCPNRLLCLNGMGRFDGVYYTNSSLYYFGAPFYWYRDTDYLKFQIRYDHTDRYWKLIQWIASDGDIKAKLPILVGSEDIKWDIINVQSYADVWNDGWSVYDDATQQYERTDTVYLTQGECPTTSVPSVQPTSQPTYQPTTKAPSLTVTEAQTISSTAAAGTTRKQSNTAVKGTTSSCYIAALIMFYFTY